MQTQKLRAKLDGSPDSTCLECLLTIAEESSEGMKQVNAAHECPPVLLTQSRNTVGDDLPSPRNFSYTLRMNLRLLISQTHEGYRVCALTPKSPSRSWTKVYESKAQCLTELAYVEIAPLSEIAETLATNLDGNIAMLVLETDVDVAVLRAAGFVEKALEYVN